MKDKILNNIDDPKILESLYQENKTLFKEEFDKAGISIPFPQRDIWIKEMPKGKKKRKK